MDQIMVYMGWERYLSVNDRYTRGTRPKLRPECAAWQEELAWRVKQQMAIAAFTWPDSAKIIVDVEIRFPEDERVRDADNYLKSILDGLEMGLGISDSRFIPFIREVQQVIDPRETGFTIRVYEAQFAGHGLRGRFSMLDDGRSVIVLDKTVPAGWLNERVCVNVGMVLED